jgi:hypothetical protein
MDDDAEFAEDDVVGRVGNHPVVAVCPPVDAVRLT